MSITLKHHYPIIIKRCNIGYTLMINNDCHDKLMTTITIDNISGSRTTTRYNYKHNYEVDAFNEVIYLINNLLDRTIAFGDHNTTSILIDILNEFDKYYQQLLEL